MEDVDDERWRDKAGVPEGGAQGEGKEGSDEEKEERGGSGS